MDESLIRDLMIQGAKSDTFSVGGRLITSKSTPVFGGVYKLVAVEKESGQIVSKIKVSEITARITNPGFKKVYRYYDRETGKAEADELCLWDEVKRSENPPQVLCGFVQNPVGAEAGTAQRREKGSRSVNTLPVRQNL